MTKEIPPFEPGPFGRIHLDQMRLVIGRDEADVLNDLRRALSKIDHVTASGADRHVLLSNDSQGLAINTFPKIPTFMARLSGNGPWYSFEEVQYDGASWVTATGGQEGTTNAREYNGTIDLSGKIVEMEVWGEELYRFFWSALGPACPDAELCVTVLGCDPADDSLAAPEENATVEVYNDTTDALVDSGTTDVNGEICFTGLSSGQKYQVKVISAFYTRDDIYIFFECVTIEITIGPPNCTTCLEGWPARLTLTDPYGTTYLYKQVAGSSIVYRGHQRFTATGIPAALLNCDGINHVVPSGLLECDGTGLKRTSDVFGCSDLATGTTISVIRYALDCSATPSASDSSQLVLRAYVHRCYNCGASGTGDPATDSGHELGVYVGCVAIQGIAAPAACTLTGTDEQYVIVPTNGSGTSIFIGDIIGLGQCSGTSLDPPTAVPSLFDSDRINIACLDCGGECVDLTYALDYSVLGTAHGIETVTIVDEVCRPTPPPEPEPIERSRFSEAVLAPVGMIGRFGRHRARFEKIAPPPQQPSNERQRISTSGGSTGFSTVTLQLNGVSGNEMTYGDTAAQVKAALEASSEIDEVNVTGGPLGDADLDVEFVGTHTGTNVNQLDITVQSPDWTVSITTLQDGGT